MGFKRSLNDPVIGFNVLSLNLTAFILVRIDHFSFHRLLQVSATDDEYLEPVPSFDLVETLVVAGVLVPVRLESMVSFRIYANATDLRNSY